MDVAVGCVGEEIKADVQQRRDRECQQEARPPVLGLTHGQGRNASKKRVERS